MNKAHTELVRERYENAVHEYCHIFMQKHGFAYNPDEWVANEVGGVLCVNDYYLDFDDIKYDIDNDVAENVFFEWYDYCVELMMIDGAPDVNYKSWVRGFRPYTREQLSRILEAQEKVQAAKDALIECVNSYKRGGF